MLSADRRESRDWGGSAVERTDWQSARHEDGRDAVDPRGPAADWVAYVQINPHAAITTHHARIQSDTRGASVEQRVTV